ncbi:MAG: site-specific DNA-methyltransferase, partial [Planctomycetaceae bacterium]|nr:site-specific DNA-methyltransferase [Planctomycetaceae bacterium]
ITDPPYNITNCKWDKKIDLQSFWNLADSKTIKTANIVLFSAEPFTADLIVSKREWFRYDLIWEKSIAMRFLDCNSKPLKAHENILVFYKDNCSPKNKQNKTTYNPQKVPCKKRIRVQYEYNTEVYNFCKKPSIAVTDSHFPRSVISVDEDNYRFNSAKKELHKHPTRKPEKLLEWLVNTYSNENDIILAPFMGSGTTGVACVKNNRYFIGIEKEIKYFEMSCERIEKAYNEIGNMLPELRPSQLLPQLN